MRNGLAIFCAVLVLACTSAPAPESADVSVIIDYGNQSREVEMTLINQTAFDAFNAVSELKLQWFDLDGDGSKEPLIVGVDGVEQTATRFWIFYVNETMAPVGAKDYRPQNGDLLMLRYDASPF